MTDSPTRYEQIPSYVFRGVAFIKCCRRTDTITMSLDHDASEDNYVIKKHDMTVIKSIYKRTHFTQLYYFIS